MKRELCMEVDIMDLLLDDVEKVREDLLEYKDMLHRYKLFLKGLDNYEINRNSSDVSARTTLPFIATERDGGIGVFLTREELYSIKKRLRTELDRKRDNLRELRHKEEL